MISGIPHRVRRWLLVGLMVLPGGLANCAFAEESMTGMAGMGGNSTGSDSQFVLFASAEAAHYTGPTERDELNEDAWGIGDFLAAINRDRFRFLAEFQLSNQEHDLERFQFGFEPVADTVIWIGRFHETASAWNTEHHHGRYLQTSVTRPSAELWEDEQGIIPQHITGILVDSRRTAGEHAGLQLSAGAGFGVNVDNDGLEPVDLLDPHLDHRRLSVSGRVAFLPSYVGTSSFGLLLAHNEMPVITAAQQALLHATLVKQDVIGLFANWDQAPWKLTSAIYDLQMQLDSLTTSRAEDAAVGYLQLERDLPHQLTAYAREENSARAADSLYIVDNRPDFELQRHTLGLRWDYWRHQALTMEVGRGKSPTRSEFEYRLQWSAAIP